MMKHIRDFRKYLPQNTFDWIVVIVGFVAIIAGGILFIGLVGIAWKKIFGKKKQPLKTMHDIFPRAVKNLMPGTCQNRANRTPRKGTKDRFSAPENKRRRH